MPIKKAAVLHGELKNLVKQFALEGIYPVGSLYISVVNKSPQSFLGGTWVLISDNTFIASKGFINAGQIGGDNKAQLVKHTHTHNLTQTAQTDGAFRAMSHQADGGVSGFVTYSYESSGPTGTLSNSGKYTLNHKHNISLTINDSSGISMDNVDGNMPQYLACYIFKRVA